MRTGKMKNVWKRIGAFALAFMLAVPVTGGNMGTVWAADTIPVVPVDPDGRLPAEAIVDNNMLETVVLEAVDKNGKTINPSNSQVRLKVGDKVKVAVRAKKELEKVLRIEGEFQYNTDFFDVVKQSDVKSDLLTENTKNAKNGPVMRVVVDPTTPIDPSLKNQWVIGWSQTSGRLTANWYPQSGGDTIAQGTNIFTITLKVQQEVNHQIDVQYKAASNGTDYDLDGNQIDVENGKYGITVANATDSLMVQTVAAKCTLENLMYGQRKFDLSVRGNATVSGSDVLKVSLDPQETVKSELPICVKEDDGYSGFTVSYTYDSYLLTPDLSDILTSQAAGYINVIEATSPVDTAAPSGDAADTTWKKVTISVVSTTNIKLTGDLMHLAFNVNKDHEAYIRAQGLDKNLTQVYVDLIDVVTQSDPANARYKETDNAGDPGRIEITNQTIDGQSTKREVLAKDNTTTIQVPTKAIDVQFTEHLVPFGDVSGDGKVNLIDATMILRYYNQEKNSELTEDQLKRADVDQSGKVNLVDAVLIIRYYNGDSTVPSLPHSVR